MSKLYTHNIRGGEYELLGTAKGAGLSREAVDVVVYRSKKTNELFFRQPADFESAMLALVPAGEASQVHPDSALPSIPTERRRALAQAPLPLDVQGAVEHAAVALSMASQAHARLTEVIRGHLPQPETIKPEQA